MSGGFRRDLVTFAAAAKTNLSGSLARNQPGNGQVDILTKLTSLEMFHQPAAYGRKLYVRIGACYESRTGPESEWDGARVDAHFRTAANTENDMSGLRSFGLAVSLLCASAATGDGQAAGQASRNIPDFTSIDLPWVAMSQDYLPPPSGPGPITYDKAHPVMERTANQFGAVRESPMRLADLNNPNLKPWLVEYLKQANADLLAGKIRVGARANCMPGGVPQFLLYAGGFENLFVIQTPKEVLMIHQADTQVRHIYMDVPHSEHPALSWYGESVGHYEGDELVVDTIGLNDRTLLDSHYDLPHTNQLHVIERFKLIDNGQALQVGFTVDDPGAFNAPWSAIVRYRHAREPEFLTEEPCAENNSAFLTAYVHPPTAGKPEF